jgi:hypothetical protein
LNLNDTLLLSLLAHILTDDVSSESIGKAIAVHRPSYGEPLEKLLFVFYAHVLTAQIAAKQSFDDTFS